VNKFFLAQIKQKVYKIYMYYLPNDVAIDVDAVIEGMLDEANDVQYFLDSKTGDVVSAGEGRSAPTDTIRYFKIPKIHHTSKKRWMKEFIRELVYLEDKKLAGKLKELFEFTGVRGVCEFLEGYGDSWLGAWEQWEGDSAFERLGDWFTTLPVPVEMKWHGDDDCAVCRAMREGVDEEELLEAFAEQNEQNSEKKLPYTEVNKSIAEVEQQLIDVIETHKLKKKLSVADVKAWVLNEKGDALQANREYMEKWMSLFAMDFGDPRFKKVMDAFTDAWNYFPHKSLGGKSPRQMLE